LKKQGVFQVKDVNYNELKKGGFMRQIQKDHFSLRLRVVGGRLTSSQLKKIYEVANKYGKGYVHLTARQGVEIPFIKLQDIEAVKKELS
jgi:dissimilatory sulfite reductase (desulfoviridin) alpha/beta subunit